MNIFNNLKKILLVNLLLSFSLLPLFGEKVTVAVFNGANPVIFTDDNGLASGFYPSLMKNLLPSHEIEYITDLTFKEAKERVRKGEIDLLPSFIKTEERERFFDFNKEPVLVSWSVLYINQNSSLNSVMDLRNKKIALMNGGQNGDNFIKFMRDLDITFEAVYFDTFTEMKQVVAGGDIFGMVAFNTLFKSDKRIKPTDIVFSPTKGYIATGKNLNKDIVEEIDKNLKSLKEHSGSVYYQLMNKWLMYDTIETYPNWLKPFICFTLITLLGILSIILILKINIKSINRVYEKQTAKLHKTECKYSLLVNNTHDLIISIDSDLRFTFLNKRSFTYFNITNSKIIGTNLKDFVMDKRCTDLFMLLVKAVEGKSVEGEVQVDNSDMLLASATPIIENGKITGAVCFAKDVTTKNEQERESNFKERLEALGAFTSCIAHDFKNLLNPVIGLTEHLLSVEQSTAESKEGLNLILKTSLKASNMIKNLLDFNMMKKVDLARSSINLLISDFSGILRETVSPNTSIEFELCCNFDQVLANKEELEQVLLNLVINSRDAMGSGGTIKIKTFITQDITKYLDRDTYVSGSFFTIEVEDTGKGIAPDLIENIFKPHFTTKGKNGSGMGLASSFAIIKKHRGYLTVNSELDKGSSFKIFLPLISKLSTPAVRQIEHCC